MKHLAVIHSEFVKKARKWKDLTQDEQKRYLRKHPGSKRRLTAKPGATKPEKSQKLEAVRGVKRILRRVRKLDALSTRAEKKHVDLNRHKVYWKLEKAIIEGEMPKGNDPYNLNPGNYDWKREDSNLITKKLNKLIFKITSSTDDVLEASANRQIKKELREGILKYIKRHYLVERKIKEPKRLEDLKKEIKTKVKKVKVPEYIGVGDRVRLSNGIEMTVTNVKHGHKYVTVNGDTDEGQHWHSKQRGSSSYSSSNLKFLGKVSQKDKEKFVKNRRDFDNTIQNEDWKRKVQGRSKIDELNIQPGSVISIKGPHYNWNATVIEVDHRKGGVRINQQRHRRQRPTFGGYGFLPGNVTTHYRFIPATAIVSKVS